MVFVYVGAGVVVLLSALVLALCYARRAALFSDRKKPRDLYKGLPEDTDDAILKLRRELVMRLDSREFEGVYITSHDGLRLFARYYHVADGAPLEIMCHGYKSMSRRDFAGIAETVMDMGHNVLLIDERAHGESEGNLISFGIEERRDVLSWVDYALRRFGPDVEIILYGVSMGGAAVLMTLELPLPKNVRCVIADCPPSSARDIIIKVAKEKTRLGAIAWPLVRLSARLSGFSLTESSAKEAVKHAKIPVLLIHGEGDTFVPSYMSGEIAAASELVTLRLFDTNRHMFSYLSNPARYRRELEDFIGRGTENKDDGADE